MNLVLTILLLPLAFSAVPLKKYNITGDLTVSGISAGGFMSVQVHVAFSNSITHAGVVAGGPYWCSQGSEAKSIAECNLDPHAIPLDKLYDYAADRAKDGQIDPLSNLNGSLAIMWSGKHDTVVPQGTMDKARSLYEHYGVKVFSYFNYTAEHGWPTNYWGNRCGELMVPYIVNCHLDYAGHMLSSFYPHGWNSTRGTYIKENMIEFEQAPFRPKHTSVQFTGYIYVPTYCQDTANQCRLHLNLHGCGQNSDVLKTTYVEHTGLNQWAETNNIIVLYPQVGPTVANPLACWDFWGYSGKDFALKTGKQMVFFQKIITAVGGKMD